MDCYLYDCPAAVCAECGHRESACTCSVGFIPPEPACTRCGLPPPFECICCHGCSRLLEECEGLADCWEEGEDDYNDYDGDFDYYWGLRVLYWVVIYVGTSNNLQALIIKIHLSRPPLLVLGMHRVY